MLRTTNYLAHPSRDRPDTPRAYTLQQLAAASGEGPGPACWRSGAWVVLADLREAAARWPRYARWAQAAGISAVASLPLRQRRAGQRVGALNLFDTRPGSRLEAQLQAAQTLADAAALGLAQRQALRAARTQIGQLEQALTSRVLIEQARGALAQRWHTDVHTAFEHLRRHARTHRLPLEQMAQAVMDRCPQADPFA